MGIDRKGGMMQELGIILFMGLAFLIGFCVCLLIKTPSKQKIEEVREEIIQEAIDHAYIESICAENDYDINIDGKGTEKIQEILEGLT